MNLDRIAVRMVIGGLLGTGITCLILIGWLSVNQVPVSDILGNVGNVVTGGLAVTAGILARTDNGEPRH